MQTDCMYVKDEKCKISLENVTISVRQGAHDHNVLSLTLPKQPSWDAPPPRRTPSLFMMQE